jgi:4-amino-4-deoxy-L-arabinose transferase-like glycosyltransferase
MTVQQLLLFHPPTLLSDALPAATRVADEKSERVSRFGHLAPLLLFAGVLFTLGLHLLLIADGSYLWTDELFSWSVAVQPTWAGMWRAMYRGSDGMFPAFYTFSWLWSRVFGVSELALRLPSILFTLGAVAAMFRFIGKRWGGAAACAALAAMVLGNGTLVQQASQFRGYGMLLAFSALGLCILGELSPASPQRAKLLWANGAVQFILCLTHPFGVLYSTALGAGRVIANAVHGAPRRWDWGLVWSWLPSLVGLLVWAPGIREIAKLNQPRGWVPALTLNDLGANLLPQLDAPWAWTAPIIGLLVLVVSAALSAKKEAVSEPEEQSRKVAIVLAVALLAVAPAAWLVSQISEPLLIPRYLIPGTWAWAVIVAATWSAVARRSPRWGRSAALGVAVAIAIFNIVKLHHPTASERALGIWPVLERARIDAMLETGRADAVLMPGDLPILVESVHNFLAREHYNPGRRDYRLIINQQSALDGSDVKGASIENNLVRKLCENGLPAEKIIDVSAAPRFVAELPAFYFIDVLERPIADRFLADLVGHGWQMEIVGECPPHRVAGAATMKKFTRRLPP